MRAAAAAGAVAWRGAAGSAASFHSTAASLAKPTPSIRFSVRQKRSDAKSALRNILLNGSSSQDSRGKPKRQQKAGGKSKLRHSASGNSLHGKGKRGQKWRSLDEDDCPDAPYGSYGGKRSFTWFWPGENEGLGSSTSGFQWRGESQSTRSKARIWSESDMDEEEERCSVDLQSHRISLGLPPLGPLKLEEVKSAFRVSALKWHPDRHEGPLQAQAEEKFKQCVEAYKALAGALQSSG